MANPENIENHRFQKGISGNPKGRPKDKKLKMLLEKMLNKKFDVQDKKTGKIGKKTGNEMIVFALIQQATRGNLQAIKEVFDRTEGKSPLVGDEDGEPIKIEIVTSVIKPVDQHNKGK